MKNRIEHWVLDAVRALSVEHPDKPWEGGADLVWAEQIAHGHLSTRLCFALAKTWRTSPMALAEDLLAKLVKDKLEIVHDVQMLNGYLNIFLTQEALQGIVEDVLSQKERYGHVDQAGQKIHLEYVSANPTGPLHVGHGRGAAMGSALAAILRTQNHEVDEVYYVNDCGRQIEILALSVYVRYIQMFQPDFPLPEKAYQGEYIKIMAELIQVQQQDRWFVPHQEVILAHKDDFAKVAEEDLESQLDRGVAHCRQWLGEDAFEGLMRFVAEEVMKGIRDDLSFFQVKQKEFKESALVASGALKSGVDKLRALGHVSQIDGQLWFESTKFGDDKDRVLVRRDQRHTYFAADVAYHLTKLEGGYDRIIDIFGSDHHGYVPRLRALLMACDYDPAIFSVLLVQFATLYRGEEKVQMSTRSGQFVTLRALSEEVGVDAARFFYLMRKSVQHMDFDIELAKKHSMDNPVYYVQYAHARIESILSQNSELKPNVSLMSEESSEALCLLLAQYPEVLSQCAKDLVVHPLVQYVRDLSSAFHSYYGQVRIIDDNPALSAGRLALIQGVRIVIHNVLGLLGVSVPESM